MLLSLANQNSHSDRSRAVPELMNISLQPDASHVQARSKDLVLYKRTSMKKVLLVFDGQHFSKGSFDFACHLNETQPILLIGIFLPSIDYTSTVIYYLGIEGPIYYPMLDSEVEVIAENIDKFKSLCEKNGISYRVHETIEGGILEGIRKETRYADLLILSSQLFYSNLGQGTQKEYLQDTTHNAECPVLLLPEQYKFPKSIVLAYDGSASSVYAIKQFAYLFPQLTSLETILVYASAHEGTLPRFDYIKELAAKHFSSLSFLKLEIDPKHYFKTWIEEAGPALLVSGAYGRSLVSELFKKSFIHEVIKDHSMPVFIAHK